VKHTGPMTAFPCEIHPLINYRTDLFLDKNHCFVPPGESRTITIRADPQVGLWPEPGPDRLVVSCWNAERMTLPPSEACSWRSAAATRCAGVRRGFRSGTVAAAKPSASRARGRSGRAALST